MNRVRSVLIVLAASIVFVLVIAFGLTHAWGRDDHAQRYIGDCLNDVSGEDGALFPTGSVLSYREVRKEGQDTDFVDVIYEIARGKESDRYAAPAILSGAAGYCQYENGRRTIVGTPITYTRRIEGSGEADRWNSESRTQWVKDHLGGRNPALMPHKPAPANFGDGIGDDLPTFRFFPGSFDDKGVYNPRPTPSAL